MAVPQAIVFDLGGTLVHWPDWDEGATVKWSVSYDHLIATYPERRWPARESFVAAMRDAEAAHWKRVDEEHWSGPPTGLVREGFDRLGVPPSSEELVAAMDGYAHAISGWGQVFPDAREVLVMLRDRGYRLGLLSNTWWAADWHNADLATHGLSGLFDALVYTSDLGYSKPHLSVFVEIASRLGVAVEKCVMVGDRMIDDVSGALAAGMRAVWRKNDYGFPTGIAVPNATIDTLTELPELLHSWGGR